MVRPRFILCIGLLLGGLIPTMLVLRLVTTTAKRGFGRNSERLSICRFLSPIGNSVLILTS